jgi:hypothetical protein
MGCKQTTTNKSPSTVPATATTTPIYVKSALKNSRVNRTEKTSKRSVFKLRPLTTGKSVNFDEKVQVKSRTPTPKEMRNGSTSDSKQASTDDDDYDDNQLSSISSQEDIHGEQIRSSTNPSNATLQRTPSIGFWHKNSSVTIAPATNIVDEKPPQLPPNTLTTLPIENLDNATGNRFRVRRKIQYTVVPQTSNLNDSNQSSVVPVFRPTVQSLPVPVPRPLSTTNTILIEHPTSLPDNLTPPTSYYVFERRPIRKKTITKN